MGDRLEGLNTLLRDPDTDPVPLLITALAAPEAEVRLRAALLLRDVPSPRAVPALVLALNDTDASVRAEVVETLGFLRSREAIGALTKRSGDKDPLVRANVAEALGAIGERGEPVVAALTRLVQDAEPVVRVFAAEALGDLGDRSVLPLLETVRSDVPLVRVWIDYALLRLGEPVPWERFVTYLADPDSNVRFQAATALSILTDESSAARVAQMLRTALTNETQANVRGRLVETLRRLENFGKRIRL